MVNIYLGLTRGVPKSRGTRCTSASPLSLHSSAPEGSPRPPLPCRRPCELSPPLPRSNVENREQSKTTGRKDGRTDGRTDRFLQAADCHEKNGTFTGKKKRKEKSHDKKRMLTKEADHHRRKGIITQEKGLSKKKRDYHANNMVDCHQKVQK